MPPSSTHEEWMAKHKGEYVRTVAEVWYCDDEVCGCYQAQVTKHFRNKVTKNTWVFESVWEGEFFTDHEEEKAVEDLVQYRKRLLHNDRDLECSIQWPEGIDYRLPRFNYVVGGQLFDPVLIIGLDDDVASLAEINKHFIFFCSHHELTRDLIDIDRPFNFTYPSHIMVGNQGLPTGANPALPTDVGALDD